MSIIYRTFLAAALLSFSGTAALAEVPRVTTDIAPVQALVARVMQGLGVPGQVVRQGASPHDYALRPSEAQGLETADAVFWIGPALTPWLERAIVNLAPNATVIELLEAPGTTVLEFRKGARFADHDHGGHTYAHGGHDGSDDGHAREDHAHEGHDHGGHDPHAWLDPENAKLWLGVIADELERLDPDNADSYRANATAGQAEINVAQAEIQQKLLPVQDLQFVVFHDAYGYFENRFGLSAAGAIAGGDAADPGPARIKAVQEVIHDLGVRCVFSEPAFNQSFVATVIDGSDARTGIIDPLGTGIAPGPDFYPSLLQAIADELVGCAG